MSEERQLFEVYEKRARGVGKVLRNRGVFRLGNFSAHETMYTESTANKDGSTNLIYRRKSDPHGTIAFDNVLPGALANVQFGEETVEKAELIGSSMQIVDNRKGLQDIDVDFRDLFSKTDSKEDTTEKSAGTSVSVSVSASEEIEGVASFEESIETEAHAEYSESSSTSSETSREEESDETTTVPTGKRVRITEMRKRADVSQEISANGTFTHTVTAGKMSHGHWQSGPHHRGIVSFESWQQFVDVVKGVAPDNINLAQSFKEHPVDHADLWALDALDAEVKYTVKYEGRVLRSYTVEAF